MSATSRPWRRDGLQIMAEGLHFDGEVLGEVVVTELEYQAPYTRDQAEADADLIVTAVNAWDDAEALRRRLHELDSVDPEEPAEDDVEYARRHA